MVWPFGQRITARAVREGLVIGLVPAREQMAELMRRFGLDASDAAAEWELLFLRAFATDFATWQTLGDTALKSAVLEAFYEKLRTALPEEMFNLLRPGVADNRWGLSHTALGEARAHTWAMAVVPGGLDQDPPRVGVAGLGDGAAPLGGGRRVLAGDHPR